MSSADNLKPCPFCGGESNLTISDGEGNKRDAEYENDPWSGLSFRIQHTYEENIGCPIAKYEEDEAMGVYLYDSREEAIQTWNKRHNDKEMDSGKTNKQYAHCMNCDYETESMSEKDLIYKISIEGGYIQSDKDGGYYSECPSCESDNLSLMSS